MGIGGEVETDGTPLDPRERPGLAIGSRSGSGSSGPVSVASGSVSSVIWSSSIPEKPAISIGASSMISSVTSSFSSPRSHRPFSPKRLRAILSRTVRTKGALSPTSARLMVFKLVMAAAKTWRRLKGENLLPKVVAGVTFKDGTEVIDIPADRAA